jgi:hypothetical protein
MPTYSQFSTEDVDSTIYRVPSSAQQMQPQILPSGDSGAVVPKSVKINQPAPKAAKAAEVSPAGPVENVTGAMEQLRKDRKAPEPASAGAGLVDEIINNWKPLALVGAAVVGAHMLGRRSVTSNAPTTTPANGEVGNLFGTEPTFSAPKEAPTAPADAPKINELQARAQALREATQPVAPAAPAPAVQGAAPAPVQAPVGAVPAQPATTSVAETVATGGNVGQSVKEVVAQELDKATGVAPKTRAPKTEQFTYKSVPEGHVFIPEMGNLDQGMQNIYGEEGRKFARDLLNEGKHFGTSANYNQDLKKLSNAYMTALQSQIPETLLSREERIAQGVPHGGQGTFGKLGKLAKVGGVVGTLLTVAEAAKAKTAQDRALAGANVIGSVLPPGADILEAGAPTLPPEIRAKQEEFAMLGSPFYNTQEAKNLRQAKKVGAGRGIAPPSAYAR